MRLKMKNCIALVLLALVVGCAPKPQNEIEFPYTNADFETEIEGKPTKLFTMKNENGMVVTLTNYGAKIVSVYVPDKNGVFADVVLGFRSIGE